MEPTPHTTTVLPPILDVQIIDYQDDSTLQAYIPEAFGPYGFDANRACLLARGMMMRPALVEALFKRVDFEATDRAAARFAKRLDIYIPQPKMASSHSYEPLKIVVPLQSVASSQVVARGQSDGEKWTEDKTELLINLHARRVKFKEIAVSFP